MLLRCFGFAIGLHSACWLVIGLCLVTFMVVVLVGFVALLFLLLVCFVCLCDLFCLVIVLAGVIWWDCFSAFDLIAFDCVVG